MNNSTDYYSVPRFARNATGHLDFTTGQTTVTLRTIRSTAYRMFIQRIVVYIKTDAAQSITFQDTANTPLVICSVPTSPGADTRWDFDFGPQGMPLTTAKSLQAAFSAAGLAGHITWQGYQTDNSIVLNATHA